MRKKEVIPKRPIAPDYKYNNPTVTKFINYIMKDGKKSVARKVVYDALDIVQKNTKKDPMEIFDGAIKNISPTLEVKTKRIGGANYQVPHQVKGDRRLILAMRWIITASKNKKGMPMAEKLATELTNAYNNTGDAIKKKEDTERMARANRAFAHFA
ncbi:MAG: 30S ribosomal protein S7 [Candidatus Spechtbacterales bacterium]